LFIRVGNLTRNGTNLLLDDVQRVSPPVGAEGERTKVEIGDVLISITADVGRLGLVSVDIGDAYINQHVALSRPAVPKLGHFLATALLDPNGFQKFIVGAQYGVTKASLSLNQVRSAPVAVPPEAEIERVLLAIESALATIANIAAKGETTRRRIANVEQAALAKAFRGELVQQDPTDEPASVLLDRIRAARADAPQRVRRGFPATASSTTAPKPTSKSPSAAPAEADVGLPADLVAAAFQQAKRLTATAIGEATGLDGPSIKKALKELVDAGQVRVEGRARGTAYEWVG
jgi:type I restriction enzyme S subunit